MQTGEILGMLLGFFIVMLYYFWHNEYFENFYKNKKWWKIGYIILNAMKFIFIIFICIISVLLAGSIMSSAKSKFWDKK